MLFQWLYVRLDELRHWICLLKVLDWSFRAGYLMWCKWSNAQTSSSVPPRSWVDSGTPVRFSRRCFLPCFLARRCRNCCVLGTRWVFHPHLIVRVCPVKVPLKLIFILYLFRCYTCCYRVSCGISWAGVVWHRWAAHGNCLSLSPLTFWLLLTYNVLPHLLYCHILVAPIKKYQFTHRLAKNADCSTDIALNRSSTLKDRCCLYWYLLDIMFSCYIIYFYSILKAQTKWIATQSKNNPVFNLYYS